MSDKKIIFLEDVAEKLEETMDYWEQYLNTVTGEFVAISDGVYIETDEELADKIDSSQDYVRLPNQYDINEYNIMDDFAESTTNAYIRELLFHALNGRKPFRHFKDVLNETGFAEAYYTFRALAFIGIARAWCEENNIKYKTRCQKEDE